jgi:RNA polymerase sigma-70 factor (ECF subfamily)
MDEKDLCDHISRISTSWTVIFQAHQGSGDAVIAAQHALLERYSTAIYRYILAALRNRDDADDVFQQFALHFVQGDFKRADPERGRFRDYVKTAIINLINKYRKGKKKHARPLPRGKGVPATAPKVDNRDKDFEDRWREQLLSRSWEALARLEEQTGQPYHTVLRFRAENPDVGSEEMAEKLGSRLGKQFTSSSVRQTLHRARQKFADLLLEEVERSLQTSAPEKLEQELIDLSLLSYCRSALKRRTRQAER